VAEATGSQREAKKQRRNGEERFDGRREATRTAGLGSVHERSLIRGAFVYRSDPVVLGGLLRSPTRRTASVSLLLFVKPFSPSSLFPFSPSPRLPFARRVTACAAAAVLALSACSGPPAPPPAASAPAPSAAAATGESAGGSTVPHGDHTPHHGGFVMMKGEDLHYEVVLDPAGRDHRIFFSDAIREDLPASVASEVALTIKRPSESDEIVAMRIDEVGESWTGSGRSVTNPAATSARLAFSIRREPYWIDLPFVRP